MRSSRACPDRARRWPLEPPRVAAACCRRRGGVRWSIARSDYTPVDPCRPAEPRPIDGVPEAFLIDALLTPAECEQLISAAEAVGLKPKRSRRSGPPIRNNSRALLEPSAELTAQLQGRLAPLLTRVDLRAIGDSWALPADGRFLNSKWRINSYNTGEAFLPHYDSGHDFGLGKRSLLSLIIYLNDDFSGGETTFFPGGATGGAVRVKPKAGAALLFHHYGPLNPLHGTEPLVATGRKKYIVRTDLIYEDQAFQLRRLLFAAPRAAQKAVLLLGVPGAGKSTQLALLAARHGWSSLNFGQCVRALRGGTSDLAQTLAAYRAAKSAAAPSAPEKSKWLPDELSLRIFSANLPAAGPDLLLLDGYPRLRSQSTQLEKSDWLLLSAIHLKVAADEQQRRLAMRDSSNRPPLELAARMQDWERDTYPLIEHYRKRGILDEVDAGGDVESTAGCIEQIVESRLFELSFAFVPAAERARLAGYAPTKRNLSKKHRVYRFTRCAAGAEAQDAEAEEIYLKIVWEPEGQPLGEAALLAAVQQAGFPLQTPRVLASFGMGPEVSGILSARVPGITLKEVFARRLVAQRQLAAQWARALARIHACVPRPAIFRARGAADLLAAARRRLTSKAVSARSFSAKYGVTGALDLERELAELQGKLAATPFSQVRLSHGDPCAPNFIWSPESQDITGCVDLSGIGYADIHWDLAIACWSLRHNTNRGAPAESEPGDLTAEFVQEYARCMQDRHALAVRVETAKLDLMYRLARFLL